MKSAQTNNRLCAWTFPQIPLFLSQKTNTKSESVWPKKVFIENYNNKIRMSMGWKCNTTFGNTLTTTTITIRYIQSIIREGGRGMKEGVGRKQQYNSELT